MRGGVLGVLAPIDVVTSQWQSVISFEESPVAVRGGVQLGGRGGGEEGQSEPNPRQTPGGREEAQSEANSRQTPGGGEEEQSQANSRHFSVGGV